MEYSVLREGERLDEVNERIKLISRVKGLTFGSNDLDSDEFLEVFTMPIDEAVEMTLRGEITDGKTQVALLRAKMMLERN